MWKQRLFGGLCISRWNKKTIKNLLLEYPDSEFLKSLDGDKVDGLLLDSEFDIGNEIAKEIYAFTGTKLGQVGAGCNFAKSRGIYFLWRIQQCWSSHIRSR